MITPLLKMVMGKTKDTKPDNGLIKLGGRGVTKAKHIKALASAPPKAPT
jgi:hypothetical protein